MSTLTVYAHGKAETTPNMIFLIFFSLSGMLNGFMDFYSLFVQAIGFIPSFISILSIQFKTRKRILLMQLTAGLMWVAHYYLLGAYTAVLTNSIGIFRSTISYFNDRKWAKSNLWLYLIIILSVLSSIVTWDGPVSLLPAISLICTATGLWIHNLTITRILFTVQSPCLFVYDIATGSWGCAIIEAVAFISFILALFRLDVIPYVKERKEKKENRL